jgi:hypothetical protein
MGTDPTGLYAKLVVSEASDFLGIRDAADGL